jgi:hypothetical protein
MKSTDKPLSSFLAIKGSLSEPTFRAFAAWDLAKPPAENLRLLVATNSAGVGSAAWLTQFVKVLNRRYDLNKTDRPLIQLVQQGWHIEDWRPVQLWHMSRNDELLERFLAEWLFQLREGGIVSVTCETIIDRLQTLIQHRLGSVNAWTQTTCNRVANGLLKMATEFSLMRGRIHPEFTTYRLPEKSFLYLLHALMRREQNTRKVIYATDWRIFLLRPADVEDELLQLHQYGKLHFQRAGSLLELTLPSPAPGELVGSTAP